MIVESFFNSVSKAEEKDSHHWYNDMGPILVVVAIKLALIYIVMMLWPRVMPKIFPSISKNPGYINLIGLSVIVSLI
tara:strand:- start:1046 stop:1276 length:231 start_codon:yes stop_codon:yes gene_type:complete